MLLGLSLGGCSIQPESDRSEGEDVTGDKGLIQVSRELRARLLADPHRPTYHIVSTEGVSEPFDPNGALFWKGRYHLMLIIQNEKGHSYAHISSTDLIHWRHHPMALEPGEGDQMVFSGGASLDREGVPTITYWGVGRGVCTATSTDDLLENWTKSPHNPVIRETEKGMTVLQGEVGEVVYGAADPSAIWQRNGRYYMLTGNLLVLREYGLKRRLDQHLGDTAYLFASDDMVSWDYLHPFYESHRKWTQEDEDNMCPDFFPLPSAPEGGPSSDRHLMLYISHNKGCQYYIGLYEEDRFEPETHGRMSWVDKAFFAPETVLDPKGRRILWAWIHDGRSESSRQASGWSGTLALPRVLWLGEEGALRMRPAPELEMLRYNPRSREDLVLPAGGELALEDMSGDTLELRLELSGDGAQKYGLKVRRSPDGDEETLVFYDASKRKLVIDTTRSSAGEGPKSLEGGPLELNEDEPLELRVFLDRSVVEVFANDRQAVMRRIYPTRSDSQGILLFAEGGPVEVRSLQAWDMAPANPW